MKTRSMVAKSRSVTGMASSDGKSTTARAGSKSGQCSTLHRGPRARQGGQFSSKSSSDADMYPPCTGLQHEASRHEARKKQRTMQHNDEVEHSGDLCTLHVVRIRSGKLFRAQPLAQSKQPIWLLGVGSTGPCIPGHGMPDQGVAYAAMLPCSQCSCCHAARCCCWWPDARRSCARYVLNGERTYLCSTTSSGASRAA